MTTDEFWDKYINDDILEIFDETCDFFSKELPEDFTEEYDVSEVIIETIGKQKTAKNFDNVQRFRELIQNKQPQLYEENFPYLDEFLIDLHCFLNEPDKVDAAFVNFRKNPIEDIDIYLRSFNKILFYGYRSVLQKAIVQNYEEVSTSEELMGGTGQDLAVAMMYISLEETYRKGADSNVFSTDEFLEKLEGYDFDFGKKFLKASEVGFTRAYPDENMVDLFIRDRNNYLVTLQAYFLKYMHKRNFPFELSGKFWDKLIEQWEDNADDKGCKPNTYFSVDAAVFEKYLTRMAGNWFSENKQEMVATLWGSVYVYDFLRSIEIIDQACYDQFLALSRVLKGKVIGLYTSDLWNYNFVHVWQKPDGILVDEFNEEENIFRKSRFFKTKDFTELKSEIAEELSNIGELSEHIIKAGDIGHRKSKNPLLKNSFGNFNTPNKPVIAEPKIGRNEPCPCGSGKKYKKCCGSKA